MVKVIDALKGVNAYPIPLRTIEQTAEGRGLSLESEANVAMLRSREFNLATADLLLWLSYAPNVTQGGQSYSFTDEQRLQLRNKAHALCEEFGDDTLSAPKTTYGYKGSRL